MLWIVEQTTPSPNADNNSRSLNTDNTVLFLTNILRVCPWENQAGGDTAQITDFAQTWHKCWVWQVNDYGKNLG